MPNDIIEEIDFSHYKKAGTDQEEVAPPPKRSRKKLLYIAIIVLSLAGSFVVWRYFYYIAPSKPQYNLPKNVTPPKGAPNPPYIPIK